MWRREKDGLWAVLAWLSILAHANGARSKGLLQRVAQAAPGALVTFWRSICGCEADSHHDGTRSCYEHCAGLHLPGSGEQKKTGALVTVEDIVRSHWAEYGRNYYTRYDCEDALARCAPRVSVNHPPDPTLIVPVLRRRRCRKQAGGCCHGPAEVEDGASGHMLTVRWVVGSASMLLLIIVTSCCLLMCRGSSHKSGLTALPTLTSSPTRIRWTAAWRRTRASATSSPTALALCSACQVLIMPLVWTLLDVFCSVPTAGRMCSHRPAMPPACCTINSICICHCIACCWLLHFAAITHTLASSQS